MFYLLILIVGCALIARGDRNEILKRRESIIKNRIKRKIEKSHRINVKV